MHKITHPARRILVSGLALVAIIGGLLAAHTVAAPASAQAVTVVSDTGWWYGNRCPVGQGTTYYIKVAERVVRYSDNHRWIGATAIVVNADGSGAYKVVSLRLYSQADGGTYSLIQTWPYPEPGWGAIEGTVYAKNYTPIENPGQLHNFDAKGALGTATCDLALRA